MNTYEVIIYEASGHFWQRRLLVETASNSWTALRAIVFAKHPDCTERRMQAHRLSPEMLAAGGFETFELIKGE